MIALARIILSIKTQCVPWYSPWLQGTPHHPYCPQCLFIVQHPFLVLTAVFSLGTVSFYSYQDVYGDFQSQHLVPRTDVLNSGLANQDTPFLLPW